MYPVVYPKWIGPLPVGKLAREDQSRNGVRVIVTRTENGTTVERDCLCMGSLLRMHDNPRCPLRDPRRRAAIASTGMGKP